MPDHVVQVNGHTHYFAPHTDLMAVVAKILGDVPASGVALAVNGAVVPRSQWNERQVENGDDVEIVRAVQGG
jgi:sulfur carrier protein